MKSSIKFLLVSIGLLVASSALATDAEQSTNHFDQHIIAATSTYTELQEINLLPQSESEPVHVHVNGLCLVASTSLAVQVKPNLANKPSFRPERIRSNMPLDKVPISVLIT